MRSPKVFTREATGLGLAAFGLTVLLVFYFDFMSSFPNDNPLMAVVVASVIATIQGIARAMLATVFPRSGSDYVFNTRILHTTIGLRVDNQPSKDRETAFERRQILYGSHRKVLGFPVCMFVVLLFGTSIAVPHSKSMYSQRTTAGIVSLLSLQDRLLSTSLRYLVQVCVG